MDDQARIEELEDELDKVHRRLSTAEGVAAEQQKKLEEQKTLVESLRSQVKTWEDQCNALRARLTAVALVIRP